MNSDGNNGIDSVNARHIQKYFSDCPSDVVEAIETNFRKLNGVTPDRFLIAWANVLLASAKPYGEKTAYLRRIENFSRSLKDGETLCVLLTMLSPKSCQNLAKKTRNLKHEERIHVFLETLESEMNIPLTVNDNHAQGIIEEDTALNAALVAQMFLWKNALTGFEKPEASAPIEELLTELEASNAQVDQWLADEDAC